MIGEETLGLTARTLRIGLEATAFAAIAGVPLGVALGLGRFRGRGALLATFNAGLRMPPVALGHGLWILMWSNSVWGGGPLSGLGWLYTLNATILAQTLLVLPIVVALVAAAVQAVPAPLLDQARVFGAGRSQVSRLALREAWPATVAALIAALGTAMASIGAIIVVGSSLGADSTLTTAAFARWNVGGSDSEAVAYGAVALGLFLAIAAALTVLQSGNGRWVPARS